MDKCMQGQRFYCRYDLASSTGGCFVLLNSMLFNDVCAFGSHQTPRPEPETLSTLKRGNPYVSHGRDVLDDATRRKRHRQ